VRNRKIIAESINANAVASGALFMGNLKYSNGPVDCLSRNFHTDKEGKMTKLRDLEDSFIECRSLRHAWDQIPNDPTEVRSKQVFKESGGVARITFRCTRCTTVKIVVWGRLTGRILNVQYKYPNDYGLEDPDERAPREARKQYIRRMNVGKVVPIRRRKSA
jgi:hypothetical protein